MQIHHSSAIFKFAANKQAMAQPCALCVVTRVSGGTLRSKGAVMAVTADETAGYVSSGCVDADIALRARRALETGKPASLRYGAGSAMRDIVLPCGGAIDITIIPRPRADVLQDITQHFRDRKPVRIYIDGRSDLQIGQPESPDMFSHEYFPKLRLRIAGRGEVLAAMANLAESIGYEAVTFSPDPPSALGSYPLTDPNAPPPTNDDASTAVILVFHDHDWEAQLLKQALTGNAFYIGAMGSTRTHLARCEKLAGMGVAAADIARIHGPIGLIPAARDAQTLALSVLAEITAQAQNLGRL